MSARHRTTITERPTTSGYLKDMAEVSELTKNDLYLTGIEVLHAVFTILRRGGTIGIKEKGDTEFTPVQFFIPGVNRSSP